MLAQRMLRIDWQKWKWTRRRKLAAALIACGAIILIILFLLLHDPSWYDPPVVLPAARQQVRNNLVDAEQAFTESLRAGAGPFVYHIYQDDVNRWLAMRREIYPLLDEFVPPVLTDPFVVFDVGKITVAGRYRTGGLSAVVSVDIAVAMQPDALCLTVAAARLGSVHMPLLIANKLGLAESVDRDPDETWPGSPRIWGSLASGLKVGADAWWKNGGVIYRVLDVSVQRGQINLTVEPRGRHEEGRDRKHHSLPTAETGSSANRPTRQ
ncbi:MAG TPA: hypothetical protein VMV94_01390 [Phycisphaerae bacterium]|nr:hypothetical protein [Phycisphaerae bacterium]